MVQRGNMAMVKRIEISLARLSAEAFAPFGHVIEAPAGSAEFAATHLQAWSLAFEAAGAAELVLCRYPHQPYELTVLERHQDVTQAFVPFRSQSPPSRTARVCIAFASEPEPGSLSMNPPRVRPSASGRRNCSRCASVPNS